MNAIQLILMTDVALSIFALIASGLTLELFSVSSRTEKDAGLSPETSCAPEEALIGNPS